MASPTRPGPPAPAAFETEHAAGPHGPPPPGRLYRLSLDQYGAMAAAGALTGRDRVVLLDGLLVAKMTKGARHVTATKLAATALGAVLPAGWHVAKEDPIALPGGPTGLDSVPEPDVAVLRGSPRDYAARHPGPADIGLVVEVADTSLREDRQGLARYARAGLPVVWLVDLNDGAVEVYTRPGPGGYGAVALYRAGDRVPMALGGRELGSVAVADLLP